MENPFRPGFGEHPQFVLGRERILAPFAEVFDTGGGKQWATHLEAHRGTGKTVILDAIQDLAVQAGWVVIQEDAGSLRSDLIVRLTEAALVERDRLRPRRRRRVAGGGVSVLGVGANVELTDEDDPPRSTLRGALNSLLDAVPAGTGVLVTVDEIHEATSADIKELGNTAQHLRRDGRWFVIVFAGLPTGADRGPTFLARCDHPAVAALTDDDVRDGLRATAALGGVEFDDRAMLHLVVACSGNPFMLQLLGYHAFEAAVDGVVTLGAAADAITEATNEIVEAITGRVVGTLPPRERDFLVGMTRSSTPARIADIRAHLQVTSQNANVIRTRLIRHGVIRPVGRGEIDFALPGLSEAITSS